MTTNEIVTGTVTLTLDPRTGEVLARQQVITKKRAIKSAPVAPKVRPQQ